MRRNINIVKENIRKIMLEENERSPAKIEKMLLERGLQTVSSKTLYKLCTQIGLELDTMQPTATATAPDSTDDEIENLTSIIEKLNKEFDKTDSNSERCRLGDSIGTAMKNRENLLILKDERERARQTKDNRTIIIRFGTPEEYNNPENQKKLKESFGEPRKTEKKKSEEKKPDEKETDDGISVA